MDFVQFESVLCFVACMDADQGREQDAEKDAGKIRKAPAI